jgi:hypothetical protein
MCGRLSLAAKFAHKFESILIGLLNLKMLTEGTLFEEKLLALRLFLGQ